MPELTKLQEVMKELESTRNIKELLETVLDTALSCIVVVDEEARYYHVQQGLLRISGRQAGGCVGA